jgi:pimeloyl-ACP methyl ester carboxylesterase
METNQPNPSLMSSITVEHGKVEIFYKIIGTGPEKVVLVMGLGCSHQAWVPTAVELAKSGEFSFLIYDNRGVGQSSSPHGRYKTSRMAQDALDILTELGPDWHRVHVVGVSMGGMISQELAYSLLEENRLASLSLFVTHAGRSSARWPPREGMSTLGRSLFTRTPEQKAAMVNNILYSQEFLNGTTKDGQSVRDFVTQAYVKRVNSEPPARLSGFLGQVSAITTHNFPDEKLHKLRDSGIPILVASGTNDYLVDHRNSIYLSEALKPVEFILWEGAGHGVPMEKFQEFNAAIYRNLQRGSLNKH